jgi:hypothetical protein
MALVDDLDAFTRAFGVENAPMVVYFSMLPWDSGQQRDQFIQDVTGINLAQVNAYGA